MKLNFVLSLVLVISFFNQVITDNSDGKDDSGSTVIPNNTATHSTTDDESTGFETITPTSSSTSIDQQSTDTDSIVDTTTIHTSTTAVKTSVSVLVTTTEAGTIAVATEAATSGVTTKADISGKTTKADGLVTAKKSTNPTDTSNSQLTFSPISPGIGKNGEDNGSPKGGGKHNLFIAFGICACVAGVILISCYFVRRSTKVRRRSRFRRLFDDNDDDLLEYESGIHTMDPLEGNLAQTSFTDEVDTSDRDRVIYRPDVLAINTTPMQPQRMHLS